MQPKSQTWPGAVREREAGFTIIETMVVVAILGVLAALAAPSFHSLIERWRVRQTADQLASSLTLARSEAIRRGGGVVLHRIAPTAPDCPADDSGAKQWGCGWTSFVDLNDNGKLDSSDTVLRTHHTHQSIQVTRSAAASFIRLNRWGEGGLGAYGFVVKPLRKGSAISMALCVTSGGRIDLREGASEC